MFDTAGFIFDFNGVLLWDTHFHDEAWRQYSQKLRGRELSKEEMIHKVHGRTNKDVMEYLTGAPIKEELLEEYIADKESIYKELCLENRKEFKLAPGAIKFLDYLQQKSTPMTIATSSELSNLRFFYKYLDLAKWFDFDLVAYDDGTVRGKPEPDLYLKAAANLNLRTADCAVVEDSRSGILAAHNAGIGRIIAIGPLPKHAELSELSGVSATIVDFFDLLKDVREQ